MILIILAIVLITAIVYVAGIVAFAKAFAEMSANDKRRGIKMTNREWLGDEHAND